MRRGATQRQGGGKLSFTLTKYIKKKGGGGGSHAEGGAQHVLREF